jgi:hypothetical protein
VALLARFFGRRAALFGGFLFATLPMSAFFGRMINYEPLTLTAVLVELTAYAHYRQRRSGGSLALLCLGIVFGGFIDWSSFFFAAAMAVTEGVDLIRRRSPGPALFLTICLCSLFVFLFDIWHLRFAGHGATGQFQKVLALNHPVWGQDFSVSTFILSQLETYRRYFTHAGLVSSLLVTFSLLFPRRSLSRVLLTEGMEESMLPLLRRLLLITLCAPTAYLLAAPSWAKAHAFWQFYFLPFAVLSTVLVARSLWSRARRSGRLWPRLLLGAFILEIAVTSAYLIHFRHTRPGGFAIEQTAMFRANYLTPDSWKGAGGGVAPRQP